MVGNMISHIVQGPLSACVRNLWVDKPTGLAPNGTRSCATFLSWKTAPELFSLELLSDIAGSYNPVATQKLTRPPTGGFQLRGTVSALQPRKHCYLRLRLRSNPRRTYVVGQSTLSDSKNLRRGEVNTTTTADGTNGLRRQVGMSNK